jgi:ribonuclease HI
LIVTIFTDASFDHRTLAAGWSAWIKYRPEPEHTIRLAGQIKSAVLCNSALGAEIAAIANALHVAAKRLKLTGDDRVVLQSDCMVAMDCINGKAKRALRNEFVKICKDHIAETITAHGFALDLRHVKAHRGNADSRSAVNSWCDRSARSQMRAKRTVLKKEKT